jgi:multiple sugar transport system permease protein
LKLAERLLKQTGFYTLVTALVIFAVWPFYWMLITAFKTEHDLYNLESIPYIFNEPPTLQHVNWLFDNTEFARWLWNSLTIGVLVGGLRCWWRCRPATPWPAWPVVMQRASVLASS